ncbi:MAG: hypothetical protein NVS9B15_07950 [Acidobacteriaceae bacterium]
MSRTIAAAIATLLTSTSPPRQSPKSLLVTNGVNAHELAHPVHGDKPDPRAARSSPKSRFTVPSHQQGFIIPVKLATPTPNRKAVMSRLLFLLAIPLLSSSAFAQQRESHRQYKLALFAGGTVAGGHVLGLSTGRTYTFAGAQLALPIAKVGPGTLHYLFEFVPITYLREPRTASLDSRALSQRNRFVYGVGASPIGFEYDLPSHRALTPFGDFSGGIVRFTDRAFSPLGARFNFTVALGGGVSVRPRYSPPLKFGYRYLHISNANISDRNPGGDFQLLYVGVVLH